MSLWGPNKRKVTKKGQNFCLSSNGSTWTLKNPYFYFFRKKLQVPTKSSNNVINKYFRAGQTKRHRCQLQLYRSREEGRVPLRQEVAPPQEASGKISQEVAPPQEAPGKISQEVAPPQEASGKISQEVAPPQEASGKISQNVWLLRKKHQVKSVRMFGSSARSIR
jgi:hypothetical protein